MSVSNGWVELTVDVPHALGDIVANFLIENGTPGVQLEDHGAMTSIIAYFADQPPLDALRRFYTAITEALSDDTPLNVRVCTIDDEDWAKNWKLHFQPWLVGERLFVCPPWDCTAPPGRVAVIIDPGMAFGTGQHATTRGCLLLLGQAVQEQLPVRALDVGTGSGVLAIALAKLGVAEVWAVDNDPTACTTAKANAQRNACTRYVHIVPRLNDAPGTFSVITANLDANLLRELAPQLSQRLEANGVLILSGLFPAEEGRVCTTYECRGFQIHRRHEEASWVTLAFRWRGRP